MTRQTLKSGQHPLTDEMCKQIQRQHRYAMRIGVSVEHAPMRTAYDLAVERMSQWIEENGYEYVAYDDYYGCQTNFSQMITDFKKAMRPQENN